jgi:hypothetical protein
MKEIRGIKNPFIVRNVPCGWFNVTLLLGRPVSPESGEFPEFVADRPAKDIIPENWCVEEDQNGDLLLVDGTLLYKKKNLVTDGVHWWHKDDPASLIL